MARGRGYRKSPKSRAFGPGDPYLAHDRRRMHQLQNRRSGSHLGAAAAVGGVAAGVAGVHVVRKIHAKRVGKVTHASSAPHGGGGGGIHRDSHGRFA